MTLQRIIYGVLLLMASLWLFGIGMVPWADVTFYRPYDPNPSMQHFLIAFFSLGCIPLGIAGCNMFRPKR